MSQADAAHKVFFGHVELGDLREQTPGIEFVPEIIAPSPGTGATRKSAHADALNAHWEITAPIRFIRTDSETGYAFWERVRQFAIDFATASTSSATAGITNWLAFVPDPLGTFTGTVNETALENGVTAGADQDSTEDDDLGWSSGNKVLVIDDASPTTQSEIVTLTAAGPAGIGATFANAHAAGSRLYRLEFYFAECWVAAPFTFSPSGHHSKASAATRLEFFSVQDAISGGL